MSYKGVVVDKAAVEKSKMPGENHMQAVFKTVTSGHWAHLLVTLASQSRDVLKLSHGITDQVISNIAQIVANKQLGAE